jgi:CheY-like chemotaxis protein
MAHRILLVDDDDAVLDVFQTLLTGRNYIVDCARNLPETEAQFRQHEYSLVISDLNLGHGKMDGLQVLWYVAQQPSKPKIVVCSGFLENDVRERVLDRGADVFLAKPFVFKQLFETLDQLLRDSAPCRSITAVDSPPAHIWTRAAGE